MIRTAPISRDRSAGFTLVELMIVMTVLTIIVAIAVPNIIAAKISANEIAAIATLRSITNAQSQFQAAGLADEDSDGQGEYGFFAELAGAVDIRGTRRRNGSDLSGGMSVNLAGEVNRAGYLFRMYLPESGGRGRRENAFGGVGPGVVDPDVAESVWGCYALPTSHAASGHRTFFTNQYAIVIHTEDPSYSGVNSAFLRPGAALRTRNLDRMTAQMAVGTVGADKNRWVPIR